MINAIVSLYDEELQAFTVSFPEYICHESLNAWKNVFLEVLKTRMTVKPERLLLNLNKHEFESIECLKFLREILTQITSIENGIYKIAFVQPSHHRKPGIVSENEAYFVNIEDAKSWLKG